MGQCHESDRSETQFAALAVDEEPLNQLLVSEGLNPEHLTRLAQSPAIINSSHGVDNSSIIFCW